MINRRPSCPGTNKNRDANIRATDLDGWGPSTDVSMFRPCTVRRCSCGVRSTRSKWPPSTYGGAEKRTLFRKPNGNGSWKTTTKPDRGGHTGHWKYAPARRTEVCSRGRRGKGNNFAVPSGGPSYLACMTRSYVSVVWPRPDRSGSAYDYDIIEKNARATFVFLPPPALRSRFFERAYGSLDSEISAITAVLRHDFPPPPPNR